MRREAKRKLEREQKDHFEDTVKVTDDIFKSKVEEGFDIEEAKPFKFTECELCFKTYKGLKAYIGLKIPIGKTHKSETISTPEKEHGTSSKDMSHVSNPWI